MFDSSTATLHARPTHPAARSAELPDPLDDDRIDDPLLVVTRRGLTRLALVATETGARFQREGVAHDPMAWMLAPRRLFRGASAIDACLERDACERAVLVHGLGLGLNADPEEVDALTDDMDDFDDDEGEDGGGADRSGVDVDGPGSVASARGGRQLFTSTLVARTGDATVHAFVATMAASDLEARRRLVDRHGPALAGRARVVAGFDGGDPLVCTLVSDVLADMLEQIALDPASPLADGLDVVVEQRFAA